jgi:hypothetical protein
MMSIVNILQFVVQGVSQLGKRAAPAFQVIVGRTFPKIGVGEMHPGRHVAGGCQGNRHIRNCSRFVFPFPGEGQPGIPLYFPIGTVTNKFRLIGIPEFNSEGAAYPNVHLRADHPAFGIRTKPGHPGRIGPGLPNVIDGGIKNCFERYLLWHVVLRVYQQL